MPSPQQHRPTNTPTPMPTCKSPADAQPTMPQQSPIMILILLSTYCYDQYDYQFMWLAEDLFLCKSIACGAFPPFFDPITPKIQNSLP
jgi:hypothetical protein